MIIVSTFNLSNPFFNNNVYPSCPKVSLNSRNVCQITSEIMAFTCTPTPTFGTISIAKWAIYTNKTEINCKCYYFKRIVLASKRYLFSLAPISARRKNHLWNMRDKKKGKFQCSFHKNWWHVKESRRDALSWHKMFFYESLSYLLPFYLILSLYMCMHAHSGRGSVE